MSLDSINTPRWSRRFTFILAATGAAVGLGNIWKFPYIMGENGGAAFVLVYLLCILIVGLPVMIAEMTIGKSARKSPVGSVLSMVSEANASRYWSIIAWMGCITGLIILSYYSVIAGWVLHYIGDAFSGSFQGITPASAGESFDALLAAPSTLLIWHSVFMGMTIAVVAAGVTQGVGRAVEFLMPLLFALLLIVLAYSAWVGDFATAFSYMFKPDFSNLSGQAVLTALGHAFFSLALGMGALMAYGAYMPENSSVARSAVLVALLDTLVALVAGLAIYPIVFATPDLAPDSGPGLLFQSLPVAFGSMSGGVIMGGIFFVLVAVAAWSSSIALIEPSVAFWTERKKISRIPATLILGVACWFVGIGSVLSFNLWKNYKLFDKFTFFDFVDFLTANILLPFGGLLTAIFVGYIVVTKTRDEQLLNMPPLLKTILIWSLKVVAPLLIALVMSVGLIKTFT